MIAKHIIIISALIGWSGAVQPPPFLTDYGLQYSIKEQPMEIIINSPKYGCKIAIVDDDLNIDGYNFYLSTMKRAGKIRFYVYTKIKNKIIRLHRLVLGVNDPGILVDHVDGDTFNNRRSNLRCVSNQQNQWNRKCNLGRSKYKGVCWHKLAKKWKAAITYNYKTINLGLFRDEISAAKSYNCVARILYGTYASLNEV